MSGEPDPKPPRRLRQTGAARSKLLSEQACRACPRRATEGHHILHRSQGGDDVSANIMPLCLHCHRLYHDGGDLEVGITDVEFAYLARALGSEEAAETYLTRRFGARWKRA